MIGFCLKIFHYIHRRNILKKYTKLLDGSGRFEENYVDINRWLKRIAKDDAFQDRGRRPLQELISCRDLALLIPEQNINDKNICKELGREWCGYDSRLLEKVRIPADDAKTPIIAANGMHLIPGRSYCIFRGPPLNPEIKCNDRWGYWKYCPLRDRWVCHSRVPGIYDAERDEFNPCSAGEGKFTIDDQIVTPEELASNYDPEQFFDPTFQERCGCRCNRRAGYIFNPQKSRTTCYKDPCLLQLPPHSMAEGFDEETGECRCGEYFFNLFQDQRQACTACPFDTPQYDEKSKTLTIFVKCGPGDLFPCETYEDEMRGCMKALIKVKPLDDEIEDKSFAGRVFW